MGGDRAGEVGHRRPGMGGLRPCAALRRSRGTRKGGRRVTEADTLVATSLPRGLLMKRLGQGSAGSRCG